MNIILDRITYSPVVRQIDMLGSLSESWNYVVKYYYRTPPATEKARLKYGWQTLQMDDAELPMNFLSRARFARKKREEFDSFLSDADANR